METIKKEIIKATDGLNSVLLFTGNTGSALLLDIVKDLNIKTVFIDTGYHFDDTLSHIKSFSSNIEIIKAKDVSVVPEDGMDECCFRRKADVLNQYLEKNNFGCLILPFSNEEVLNGIEGSFLSGVNGKIEIVRPLSSYVEKDIWTGIRDNNLRFNELYKKGYGFIDCRCCITRFKRRSDSAAKEPDQMDIETVEKLKALGYM
ncbi:MAG: phosphoadenosine phosphosulfate reductase family protein [Nitrospirae bacterium]|nr:phosphoadenosine phosphosulfate reductase family protein [Nitrospirota bacterium]